MIVAIRGGQARLDQLDGQRTRVRLLPSHHHGKHIQINSAVKCPQRVDALAIRVRHSLQGKFDAGEDRFLPAARKFSVHFGHQLHERFAGCPNSAAAQGRGEQRQGACVAIHRVHELLDLLPCRIGGSAGIPAGGVQHPLDELDRILAIKPV
jgi:hypothetical protein